MRHLLLAVLLVAMTGRGSDTKPEEPPTAPAETAAQKDQPTVPAEIVSSPETPKGGDEPSAKADVPAVNSVGMRFVPIPAGTFTMGEGKTAHQVTLTQSFHLGQYEVTQEHYEKVMGNNHGVQFWRQWIQTG
jgi:formylglycine-generating enzyme required for sulfatase activity